jgi:hypothetical protein
VGKLTPVEGNTKPSGNIPNPSNSSPDTTGVNPISPNKNPDNIVIDPLLNDVVPANYTDTLSYELYTSTLNEEQRSNYTFWIKYKNSFSSKGLAKVSLDVLP